MARLLRKRGSGRRRGNSAPLEAAEQLNTLRIDRSDWVPVDSGSTLLRIEGRPSSEDADLRWLSLAIHTDAGDEERPLLAPPARIGEERWQLAFAVPTAAVEDPRARFELAEAGRTVAEVPGPGGEDEALAELRARIERERNGRLRAEEHLGDKSQDLADARALLEQLERRCEISERNLTDLRQKLLLAWTESNELRQLLDAREGTHERTKHEVRRRRAAERELRVLLGRQERDLVAARERVQARCKELAEELSKREAGAQLAQAELDEARARTTKLQEDAQNALADFELARGEAEQTRAQLEQLHAQLADVRGEAKAAHTRLEREVETLKVSERKLEDELSQMREALESAQSGRRGKLRKALRDAEAERARLESELTGLLFRLGDLEETLVETRDLEASAA